MGPSVLEGVLDQVVGAGGEAHGLGDDGEEITIEVDPAPLPTKPVAKALPCPECKNVNGPGSERCAWCNAELGTAARVARAARPDRPRLEVAPEPWPDLRDDLAEYEFFASQGLGDDAKQVLDDLLETHPGHPELLALAARHAESTFDVPADQVEVIADTEDQRIGDGESGPIETTHGGTVVARVPSRPAPYWDAPASGNTHVGPVPTPETTPEPMPAPLTTSPMVPAFRVDSWQSFPPADGAVSGAITGGGTVVSKAPPAPPSSAVDAVAKLSILGPDGRTIGERTLIVGEPLTVGPSDGLPWEASPDQFCAELAPVEEGVRVKDDGSLDGVFVMLTAPVRLQAGDQIKVGESVLVFEDPHLGADDGSVGSIHVASSPQLEPARHLLRRTGLTIGREVGEIKLLHDTFASDEHCRVSADSGHIVLEDLHSSNGTYVRVRSGQVVPFGSFLLIGKTLMQLERS